MRNTYTYVHTFTHPVTMVVSGEFTAVHKTVAYMRTKLHRRGVDRRQSQGREERGGEQGGEGSREERGGEGSREERGGVESVEWVAVTTVSQNE